MKRVSLYDIESQYKIQQYRELYDKVMVLINAGRIKPVKASGKNGKKPALYNEYWILEPQEDDTAYIEELSYLYVPMISTHYYLNHIRQLLKALYKMGLVIQGLSFLMSAVLAFYLRAGSYTYLSMHNLFLHPLKTVRQFLYQLQPSMLRRICLYQT